MERKIGGYNLADFYAEHKRKRPNFLDDVSLIIKWSPVEKLLHKRLARNYASAPGARPYPALTMFKILLLQAWHNLGDLEMEYALCDRISFSRFAGFSLDDETPDHTTICRFRNLLLQKGLMKKLLDEINKQLEVQGKLVKTGCIVDASIISSAARPKKVVEIDVVPEERKQAEDLAEPVVTVSYSHDTDAAWTRKGKDFWYGYKVHAATDARQGFILSAHVTPANRSDTVELEEVVKNACLTRGCRVYADKGYPSKSNCDFLRREKLRNGIMDKAQRNKALTERERKRNKLISSVRGTVERSFGTLKQAYALRRAKYIGIAKVELNFLLCAMAFNIKKAILLPPS